MIEDSIVSESFGRCILKEDFLDRFYEIFINSDPAIKPMFANTDFNKQKELLRKGLSMAVLFFNDSVLATSTLNRIRETHNRHQLNINPRLYPFWVDSLMKTIAEFDERSTPETERAWRTILQKAVNHIMNGY